MSSLQNNIGKELSRIAAPLARQELQMWMEAIQTHVPPSVAQ